jgi:DNA-binding transcriptional regulator GbsR (MarR family)
MNSRLLIPTALLALLVVTACDETARAGDRTRTTYYEVKDYTYEQRDSFRADMERAIAKLESRLAELRAKASGAGKELKAETKELIDEIEAKLPEMRENLARAGDATQEGWQDFKRNFRETFDDLGRRLEDAFD